MKTELERQIALIEELLKLNATTRAITKVGVSTLESARAQVMKRMEAAVQVEDMRRRIEK